MMDHAGKMCRVYKSDTAQTGAAGYVEEGDATKPQVGNQYVKNKSKC